MKIKLVPGVISVTELQRNPKKISELKPDEYKIIVKNGKELGFIGSMDILKNITNNQDKIDSTSSSNDKEFMQKTALRMGDPAAYQEKIRSDWDATIFSKPKSQKKK